MKIPFDIKYRPQFESGEYKVETRDGKPARIVCWDLKGNDDFFILALVEKNEREVSYCYPATGCCKAACDPEGKDDLFIITPEPELTEFEDAVGAEIFDPPFNEEQIKVIKEESAKLLELAKEELQEKVIHDYWKQAADRCAQAKEEGKAEALNDLPRWKKCDPNTIYKTDFNFVSNGVERHIILNGYMINLDRLKKLPGFNE